MRRLYRVAAAAYAMDLSGEGSRLFGGRWTPKGMPAIYASEHPALSGFEQLVQGGIVDKIAPLSYRLAGIDVTNDGDCELIENVPDDPVRVGAAWLMSQSTLLLCVPSVVVPCSWNYIINPQHPGANDIEITDLGLFSFDPRIGGQNGSHQDSGPRT